MKPIGSGVFKVFLLLITLGLTVEIGADTFTSVATSGYTASQPDVYRYEHKGARLIVPKTEKINTSSIHIERISNKNLPPLPPGMVNATLNGGGYRFLPAGTHFDEAVQVQIPLEDSILKESNRSNIPVYTFYWDEDKKRWLALERVRIDFREKKIVSETTHFTTMINAVLAPPEHPAPLSYNPNSIKDLAVADPAANIDLIQPPLANSRGTAELSYPIKLPAGRGSYTPNFSLTYSSSNGMGWLGIGWTINIPKLEVDTRWGVPRYDGTERYLLNGEAIVPIQNGIKSACKSVDVATVIGQYSARRENFQQIAKCSSNKNVYWEVTEKDGTRFEYGSDIGSRLTSYYQEEEEDDHIAIWFLKRVIDPNGNTTEYKYAKDSNLAIDIKSNYQGEPFVKIYLSEIEYTRHTTISPAYHVSFNRNCSVQKDTDSLSPIINGRYGFKVLTRCVLSEIQVETIKPVKQIIRSYDFNYDRDPDFGKTRLISVQARGSKDTEFYTHTFEYTVSKYKNEKQEHAFAETEYLTFNNSYLSSEDVQVDRTDEVGNSGSLGVGIEVSFEVGSANAGCGLEESARIDVDRPQPEIRHIDINADRIPDRVWLDSRKVRVLLGTTLDETANTYPSVFNIPNLNEIGRQKTLGGSGGVSASCSVSAGGVSGGVNAGIVFTTSKTGAKSLLGDGDGDGILDLVSIRSIIPSLPHECRDGQDPDPKSCKDGFCICSDGLTICEDKKELCFGLPKPQYLPTDYGSHRQNTSVTENDSSHKDNQFEAKQNIIKYVQTKPILEDRVVSINPTPLTTRNFRKVGFNDTTAKLYGNIFFAQAEDNTAIPVIPNPPNSSSNQKIDTTDILQAEPVKRRASGAWGPYTSQRSRLQLDPKQSEEIDSFRSVIRWDVQYAGTIEIDAQARRKFLAGKDGVKLSLVHVHPTKGAKNTIISSVHIEPDNPDINWVIPQKTSIKVAFGDSILVVTDPLLDNPIDFFEDISLDDIRLKLHIEYTQVCQYIDDKSQAYACRAINRETQIEENELIRKSPYIFDYPNDFNTAELPRLAYWQLLPPIGPSIKNKDGSFRENRIIGQVTKTKKTSFPVIARIRCEPFTANPKIQETWKIGDDSCSQIGGILWEHSFLPEDKEITVDTVVKLPSPFTEIKLLHESDLVVLVGKNSTIKRYSDLNKLGKKIRVTDETKQAALVFFPLAELVHSYPMTLFGAVKGLEEGSWDAFLVSYSRAQKISEYINKANKGISILDEDAYLSLMDPPNLNAWVSKPSMCCPLDSPSALGKPGSQYLPRRLLFEVTGEGGEVVLPDQVQWSPTMEINTLYELQSNLVATDETPVLIVSRNATKGKVVHSYGDLNKLSPTINWLNSACFGGGTISTEEKSKAFLKRVLPNGIGLCPDPRILIEFPNDSLEYYFRFVSGGSLTAVAMPFGEAKKYIREISNKIQSGEKVPGGLNNLQESVFVCCAPDNPLPDYTDSVLLVRDIEAAGRAPKKIQTYQDIINEKAILNTVNGSKEAELVSELFSNVNAITDNDPNSALNTLLNGQSDALFVNTSVMKKLLKDSPSVGDQVYPCCPRGMPLPMSTVVDGIDRGALIEFKPEEVWRQNIPVVYRTHHPKELIPFLTDRDNQSLQITINASGTKYPLTVTVSDEYKNELLRQYIPANDQDIGVPIIINTTIPKAGLYYVKGYTEATFNSKRDPKVTLFANLKDDAYFAAIVHLELREIIKSFENLKQETNITFIVVPNSPEEAVVHKEFPNAKIEYKDDIFQAIQVASRSTEVVLFDAAALWNPVTWALLDKLKDSMYLLPDFTNMPKGNKPVPTNIVTADFGCGVVMSELVGDLPYSIHRWSGGYKGFFYGQISTKVELDDIGKKHWCDGFNEILNNDELLVTSENHTEGENNNIAGLITGNNPTSLSKINNETYTVTNVITSEITQQAIDEKLIHKNPNVLSKQKNRSEVISTVISNFLAISSAEADPLSPPDSNNTEQSLQLHCTPYDLLCKKEGPSHSSWQCTEGERMSDRDGDLVPSCRDKCPEEAEDIDGVEDHDGCPEGNNDIYHLSTPPGFGENIKVKKLPFNPKDPSPPLRKNTHLNCFQSHNDRTGICSDGSTFGGSGGDGDNDSDGGSLKMGPTLRQTTNFGTTYSAGVNISLSSVPASIGVNASKGSTSTYTSQEYMDWNGDSIPDRVSPGEVYIAGENQVISLGIGCSLPDPDTPDCKQAPAIRESINNTSSIGVSSGITQTLGNKTSAGGRTKEQGLKGNFNNGMHLNLQWSDSATAIDRIDINGDGLPDIVTTEIRKDSTGQENTHLFIQLNLGYRLGKREDWGVINDSSNLNESESLTTGFNLSAGGGFKIFGIGASIRGSKGHSITGTNTLYSLLDLNSDGFPDLVTKDGNELTVSYGRGGILSGHNNAFLKPQKLTLPEWVVPPSLPNSSKDIFSIDPFGVARKINKALNDQDGLYVSGSNVESVSGTISAGFIITVTSAYYHKWGKSFTELGMYDADGDGMPDRVLRQGSEPDANIQIQNSRLGGANFLKVVNRPLGGKIEFTYEQQNPSVQDPNPRWILDSFELKHADKYPTDFVTTSIKQDFEYREPYYDRIEKEFMGFKTVRTIRADDTVIESVYNNRDYRLQGTKKITRVLESIEDRGTGKITEVILQEKEEKIALKRRYDTDTIDLERDKCLAALHYPIKQLANETAKAAGLTPCDVWFAKPTQSITRWFEGKNQAIETAVIYEDYDQYGNIAQIRDTQNADNPKDDLLATINYDAQPDLVSKYIVNRATSIDVVDTEGNKLRYRSGSYDSKGNLKHHEVWATADGNKKSTLDLDYNDTGFLTKITDTNDFSVTYTPDNVLQMLAKSTKDSLGLESSADYDYRWQTAISEKDINGQQVKTEFDQFGRLSAVSGAYELEANKDSLQITYAIPLNKTWPAYAISTNLAVHPETGKEHTKIQTSLFIDGLGRNFQTQVDAEVQQTNSSNTQIGRVISGKTLYDQVGRLIQSGQPEFKPGKQFSVEKIAINNQTATIQEYDALDRVTKVTEPGSRITKFTYSLGASPRGPPTAKKRMTTTTDAEGKVRIQYHDAADRIVAVEQILDGKELATTYTYSPIGELQEITDARGNKTELEYDLAGQRTAVTTPDTGRLELAYDNNGNLIEKTDQALCDQVAPLLKNCQQQKITYTYAKNTNRLETVNSPNLPQTSYTYGDEAECENPKNARGRICQITDNAGIIQKTYGRLGEVLKTTRVTEGAPWLVAHHEFTTEFVYDSFGRMLHLTYPDLERLSYKYDAGGQVKQVTGKKANKVTTYVEDIHYNEFGQRVWMQYGNGVVNQWEYEPETRRLHNKTIGIKPVGLKLTEAYRSVQYEYDQTDNVLKTLDRRSYSDQSFVTQVNQSFSYDDLHRLNEFTITSLRPTATGVETDTTEGNYVYDEVGNIQQQVLGQQKNGVTDSHYPSRDWTYQYSNAARPNLPETIGPYSFIYDARGSVKTSILKPGTLAEIPPGSLYQWNDKGRLAESQWGNSAKTGYLYGAEGHRVRKQTPATLNNALTDTVDRSVYINNFYTARFIKTVDSTATCQTPPCWNEVTSRSKHIYIDGERVAVSAIWVEGNEDEETQLKIKGETRHFLHSDPVSSVTLITDSQGKRGQEVDYLPFGEVLSDRSAKTYAGLPQAIRFDGKELDAESGLQYFGFRYYDPRFGRWISADPLILVKPESELENVNELNLFSFSRNNPVNRIETVGLRSNHGQYGVKGLSRSALLLFQQDRRVARRYSESAVFAHPLRNIVWGVATAQIAGAANLLQGGAAVAALGSSALVSAISTGASAASLIVGEFGTISSAVLQKALLAGGPTVTMITRLTQSPQAGRALSAASGQTAQALSKAARVGGSLFRAKVPKGLLVQLESVGLVRRTTTLMGKTRGLEYRFHPNAAEFVKGLFRKVKELD